MTRLKSHQIGIGNREPLSKGSDDIEEAESDCALNNNNNNINNIDENRISVFVNSRTK
jgi:hypothetical protein